MYFIYDEDLITLTAMPLSRINRYPVDHDIGTVIDPSVGSSVDLPHISRTAFHDFLARRTLSRIICAAWSGRRKLRFMTVKRLSEEPRGRSFSHSTCA